MMEAINILDEKLERAKKRRIVLRSAAGLAAMTVIIYIMLGVVFGVSVVKGESMSPTLPPKTVVIYYRLAKEYKRGDIIVFTRADTGEELIKRITATAGERVEIYALPDTERITGNSNPELEYDAITIEEGYIFVLGDNYEDSIDSRVLGPLPIGSVSGKVIRYFR